MSCQWKRDRCLTLMAVALIGSITLSTFIFQVSKGNSFVKDPVKESDLRDKLMHRILIQLCVGVLMCSPF